MFSLIWTLVLSVRHETLQGVYSLLLTWYWRSSYNCCPEKLRTATGHLQQLLHALSAEHHWASGFLAHCFPASVTQAGRYLLYWGTCFGVGAYVSMCVDEYACVCSWVWMSVPVCALGWGGQRLGTDGCFHSLISLWTEVGSPAEPKAC